jgi:hypothetical protein
MIENECTYRYLSKWGRRNLVPQFPEANHAIKTTRYNNRGKMMINAEPHRIHKAGVDKGLKGNTLGHVTRTNETVDQR